MELRKALESGKPSRAFEVLRDVGALQVILPELQALVGVEQPSKWHIADAFEHTMVVVDATATMGYGVNLRLAALFHDLGKATTQSIEADGNIHFYSHQFVSEKLVHKIDERLNLRSAGFDVNYVAQMARHHMDPIQEFKSDQAVKRFINRMGGLETALELVDLRVADKKGGRFPESMEKVFAFRRKVHEIANRKEPFGIKGLAISGRDLIDMGLEPGKLFKEVLTACLDLVLEDPKKNTNEFLRDYVQENYKGRGV